DIAMWDVANEEIPRMDRYYEQFHQLPDPEEYLPWIFQEAGNLFADSVPLLYNDGTRDIHNMPDKYVTLMRRLKSSGARLGGLGIQFHVGNGLFGGKIFPPQKLIRVYNQLSELEIPMYITEITINGSKEN